MLDVIGDRYGTCDGLSRRSFLRVGALGLAGLTLPDILRQRALAARSGAAVKDTAVIQIFLAGGPTHIDTYDPKPDAPKEIRGEFAAIPTNLAGVSLSELMPRQASVLDKLAILRSLHHETADHSSGTHWVMTGFPAAMQLQRTNDRPSVGSIVAKLRGPNRPGVPPYVAVPNPPPFSQGAYLGPGYNPFGIEGNPAGNFRVRNLDPASGLSMDRLEDRRYLLERLDRLERERDASGMMDGIDRFTTQAYEMVTGPAARRAFDLSQEDPRIRDKYGRTRIGQSCLLARRLIEAGVTFVTINEGNWDHHSQLVPQCKNQVPPLDAAIASLVEDLYDRGLTDRVLVLVWGEFGRSPRINNSGRDHWPGAMSAVVAGGGLRMGQVIGATTRKGEMPSERPLRPEDLLQTVYHVLGINTAHEFPNESGRPMPVLNRGHVITELLS
ncbi:MAG: DUF1501 domain-containing protein [Isosphaeraceae bacterium]|nr:DUF1501 domain-containing protein [Isosphaeraceae bacterium]